jgi:hypothetical protein
MLGEPHDLVAGFCCRSCQRESFLPGCCVHVIPALYSANEGPWRRGVVLDTDDFVITVAFDEAEPASRLQTLWMDRFEAKAADDIERDGFDRPIVQYGPRWRVLRLIGGSGHPLFDVADSEDYPDAVRQWTSLPASCLPAARAG